MNFIDQLLSRRVSELSRWHHRPVVLGERERLSEHLAITARIAFELALLVGRSESNVDPALVAVYALYHDEPELILGDVPRPVKDYFGVEEDFEEWEWSKSESELWKGYPERMRESLIRIGKGEDMREIEKQIMWYADKLSAFAFARDQVEMGNKKMADTLKNCRKQCEEFDYDWLNELRKEYQLP